VEEKATVQSGGRMGVPGRTGSLMNVSRKVSVLEGSCGGLEYAGSFLNGKYLSCGIGAQKSRALVGGPV